MASRFILVLLLVLSTAAASAGQHIRHAITVTVDPLKHTIDGIDTVTIPAGTGKRASVFLLAGDLTPVSATPGVTITLVKRSVKAADIGIDRDDAALPSGLAVHKYSIVFADTVSGERSAAVRFSGAIHHPVKQEGEEYARGFSQTPGIIDEKGVYLAGSTYWIPWFNTDLISFELTVSVPERWSVVSQGRRTLNEVRNGVRTVRWNAPEPTEEAYLIAAQFTEYSKPSGAVDVLAFLRTPDESLANKYLETTAQYLEMYRKLIGPYPFTKFALVENFWETGYGMPSFTLLGEQVIRFPFILHSSYPHELLHNYWGNSVYIDFAQGNWCEGLTAYMADHLIAEQRGQGDEYRRTTLQKFTDYVNAKNDFPLRKFRSRNSASSEAIGYGKSLMVWNMLRNATGDELFVKGFQKFYRDNKFKVASFADIRTAFESVTKLDLRSFFDQWVNRTGAPALTLSGVSVRSDSNGYVLRFTVKQTQKEDVFTLDVPVAVSFAKKTDVKTVAMTQREQSFEMRLPEYPLQVQVDPQFSIFRKLHHNEIPPSFSKIFGTQEVMILLPSKAEPARRAYYAELAKMWADDTTKKFIVAADNTVTKLPKDKNIWIFGTENLYASEVRNGLREYDASLTNDTIRFAKSAFRIDRNSIVVSVRHPENPGAVLVLLSADTKEAVPGLARKLPHYGKYSYLVFEGTEPTNIAKGEWEAVISPLSVKIPAPPGMPAPDKIAAAPKRKALATLDPVFSSERMKKTVDYLAGAGLAGRAPGTKGGKEAAAYIEEAFRSAGLMPGADDGSYTQRWVDVVDASGRRDTVWNVIGIIPGTNPKLQDASVVVSAHYDHLGLGWPGAHAEHVGKIHPGADDNASGVSVMLELARTLGTTLKPQRNVVFAAFTSEENGLAGSKYYVANTKRFPAAKTIGVLNFDAVGRLGARKVSIINSSSAREWKFIFMGASYVTGVETEIIMQDLDASDQKSFIEAGVPGVQFFSGATADYHRPSDTPDKIDVAGLVKVAAIGREGVLYLADRLEPLAFQAQASAAKPSTPQGHPQGQAQGERRVSTGTVPDFAFSGTGVRIDDLTPNSPGVKAGLRKGDVIVRLGTYPVASLRDYSDALKHYQPGDVVDVVYERDGKEQTTKLELAAK